METITVTPNDNLQHILDNITVPTTIYMKKGTYRTKLYVRCDNVKIIGEDRETSRITYADYAKKPHADGREYNTFRTYTLCITGNNVTLENLTVENSNTAPEKVGQCVALSVNAPRFLAKNVGLVSTQDTLFTAPFPDDLVIRYSGLTDDPTYYDGFIPREQLYMEGNSVQIYEKCKISGTVDFIFGGAEAYFYDCDIISLGDRRNCGYVAAPSHSLKQKRGYAFIGCRFTDGGAEKDTIYLARPWRDFGKCDFIDCTLEGHIAPALYDKWNDTYRDKTARFAHCNLTGRDIAPVAWSKELSRSDADNIIKAFKARKKSFNER